jgi:hypothetical protein
MIPADQEKNYTMPIMSLAQRRHLQDWNTPVYLALAKSVLPLFVVYFLHS